MTHVGISPTPLSVAVAGATGFVGSRLLPFLLGQGHAVRALTRDATTYEDSGLWDTDGFSVAELDLLDDVSIDAALAGCDVAVYLVHSMAGDDAAGFAARDLAAARIFADGCRRAGVRRIVYLGGLLPANAAEASEQLQSRRDTGDALREAGVPVTELRAGIIVGAGGASFEILRTLAQLPLIVAPEQIDAMSEPIAVDDVVHYLAGCVTHDQTAGETYDIGCGEPLTYRDMIETCARLEGSSTRIITVAVPSLALFAHTLSVLVRTELGLVRPLIEGMGSDLIARDRRLEQVLPTRLQTFAEAAGTATQLTSPDPVMRVPTPADVARAARPLPATTLEVARDALAGTFRTLPRVIESVVGEPPDSELGEAVAPPDVQRRKLVNYLQDAVAMERNVLLMLTTEIETTRNAAMRERLREHRDETEEQETRLLECLAQLGATEPIARQSAALSFAAVKGTWNFLRGDKPLRNLRDLYIVEHAEIAGYELLLRIARAANEPAIARVVKDLLEQERRMAADVEQWWDEPFRTTATAATTDGRGVTA